MTTISAVQALPGRVGPQVRRPDRTSVHRSRLELTRRGRLVASALVFLAVLAIAATALVALGTPTALASWGDEQQYVSVTVQPGDTLWGYAEQYAPAGTDPRDFVLTIQEANGLPTGHIATGSQIDIPVEG